MIEAMGESKNMTDLTVPPEENNTRDRKSLAAIDEKLTRALITAEERFVQIKALSPAGLQAIAHFLNTSTQLPKDPRCVSERFPSMCDLLRYKATAYLNARDDAAREKITQEAVAMIKATVREAVAMLKNFDSSDIEWVTED